MIRKLYEEVLRLRLAVIEAQLARLNARKK